MSKKNVCVLEVLLCALMWSTAGICMKFIPWNPLVLSGVRSFISGVTIGVFLLIGKKKLIFNKKTLGSGISLCLTFTFFVAANKLTTAANAIVLQFTSPIFIVILSALFLHKKAEKSDIAAVIFTLFGIAMFFLDQLTSGTLKGNICAIVAGISMASMYMINGECSLDERMSGILTAMALSFIIGLPFIFGAGPMEINKLAVGSVLFLGIFQLGIPYILYAKAAEGCPALACCLIGAVEPLLNPVWVFLFDGEKPGIMALIGGAIVIGTVTVWTALGNGSAKEAEVK